MGSRVGKTKVKKQTFTYFKYIDMQKDIVDFKTTFILILDFEVIDKKM